MPWSVIENVPPIINEVHRLQPESMIELGIGFGKYGVLCRETLDGIYGRCRPDQWTRKIAGVEAFEAYRNPCWGAYSRIEIEDFATAPPHRWDLVLMVDSLEHLEQGHAEQFLDGLVANNRRVIISVPNGPCVQPAAVHGNAFEIHRATFYPNSFDKYGAKILHLGYCIVASIPGRV